MHFTFYPQELNENILNLFYLIPDQVCVLRIDAVTQFIISGYDDVTLRHLLCVPLHSRVTLRFFFKFVSRANCSNFQANVMWRQPRIRASRASPAQKWRGLRVVLFQKLFKGYIYCLLGIKVINVGSDTFGNPIFHEGLQN